MRGIAQPGLASRRTRAGWPGTMRTFLALLDFRALRSWLTLVGVFRLGPCCRPVPRIVDSGLRTWC